MVIPKPLNRLWEPVVYAVQDLVVAGDGEGSGATLNIVQAIYAETTSTNSQKDTACI